LVKKDKRTRQIDINNKRQLTDGLQVVDKQPFLLLDYRRKRKKKRNGE